MIFSHVLYQLSYLGMRLCAFPKANAIVTSCGGFVKRVFRDSPGFKDENLSNCFIQSISFADVFYRISRMDRMGR